MNQPPEHFVDIRAVIEGIPTFADAGGLAVEPLRGVQSLNNLNWIVRRRNSAEKFVLRIANPASGTWLGIKRDEEAAAARAAAAAGIAPELVYYDASNGSMVTMWVDSGRPWTTDDFRDPRKIRRLVEVLHRMHSITNLSGRPGSVYRRIEHLVASAQGLGMELPGRLDEMMRRLADVEAHNAATPSGPPGLNHNDLWSNNLLDEGPRIQLVDWEFSGFGDGLYDLATVSMAGGYEPQHDAHLLGEYGLTGPANVAALQAMKWVVRLFEALWSLTMHGLTGRNDHPGSSGFDYLHHSRSMFDALSAES